MNAKRILNTIVSFALILSVLFLCNGCTANNSNVAQAEKALKKAISALNKENASNFNKYVNLNGLEKQAETAKKKGEMNISLSNLKELIDLEKIDKDKTGALRNVSYNIVSSDAIDANTVKITVQINAISYSNLQLQAYNQLEKDIEGNKMQGDDALIGVNNFIMSTSSRFIGKFDVKSRIRDIIKTQQVPFRTNQIDITMQRAEKVWRLQADMPFYYAILGYSERDFYDETSAIKYGYVDENNNTVIDFIYNEVQEFNEYGIAIVKDEDYGFINTKGDVVLALQYAKIERNSDGGFNLTDKEGETTSVNASGQVATSPQEVKELQESYEEAIKSMPEYAEVLQKALEELNATTTTPTPRSDIKLFAAAKDFTENLPEATPLVMKKAGKAPRNYSVFKSFGIFNAIFWSLIAVGAIIIIFKIRMQNLQD